MWLVEEKLASSLKNTKFYYRKKLTNRIPRKSFRRLFGNRGFFIDADLGSIILDIFTNFTATLECYH